MSDVTIQSNFKVGPKCFSEFELKDTNLRKVRVTKSGGIGESLWAYLSDDDLKLYDNDTSSGIAIAVCCNDSLNGIPFLAYFPFQFKGQDVPECDMDDCIDFTKNIIMHKSEKEYYKKVAETTKG